MTRMRKRVKVDGRTFIVVIDDEGPRMIYERKLINEGHLYLEKYVESSYWHRNNKKKLGKRSMVAKIIEAVEK